MNRRIIYFLVFITGILTITTASCMIFARMQYMVYRLNKVTGMTPCGDWESFCQNINRSQFEDMNKTMVEQWVQSQSAYVAMATSFVGGIIGLITIVPLGFISDRFGRKYGLIIAYTGFGVEAILNALVVLLHLPLWVFIVATLPSSVLGNGAIGILTQLYVCITDLTEQQAEVRERRLSTIPPHIGTERLPPQTHRRGTASILEKIEPKSLATVQSTMASERLSYLALFQGCLGVTAAASTMVMGPALQKFGFSLAGWVIIILTVVNLVNAISLPNTRALWYKPETKAEQPNEFDSESRRQLLSVSSTNTSTPQPKKSRCHALNQAFAFVTIPIILGILSNSLTSMIEMSDITVLNLYFIADPFAMTISQVGLAIGLRNIGSATATCLFVLFNLFYLQPRLATPSSSIIQVSTSDGAAPLPSEAEIAAEKKAKILEARTIALYSLSGIFLIICISRFLYGISSSFDSPTCFVLLFIGMFLNAFNFYGPLLRVLLSGLVPCDVQGRLYALIGFSDALGAFVGFTALPPLFVSTIYLTYGFVFYVAALLVSIAFVLNAINIYLLLYRQRQ